MNTETVGKPEGFRIVNLTQHAPTPEQIEAGVYQPKRHKEIVDLLTFHHKPTREEVLHRAEQVAELVTYSCDATSAMIGGAPYLMGPLAAALKQRFFSVCFSYSERVSTETTLPDGSVSKTSVFKHVGFVWA